MANQDAGRTRQMRATEDQDRARAVGARKPGVVGRMMDRCRDTVEGIRLPRPDWRTFAWGLLLLIVAAFIIANWAPLRINLFGWYLDAPRAVVWAIFFVLGMITTWLIEMRCRRGRDEEGEGPEVAPRQERARRVTRELPEQDVEPAPEEFAEERVEAETEQAADEFEDVEEPEPEPDVDEPVEDEEEDASGWFTPVREPEDESDEVQPTAEDFAEEEPVEFESVDAEDKEEPEAPEEAPVIEEFAAPEADEGSFEEPSDEDEEFAPVEDFEDTEFAAEDETAGDAFTDDYAFGTPEDDSGFAPVAEEVDEPVEDDLGDDEAWEADPDFAEAEEDDEALEDDSAPRISGGTGAEDEDGGDDQPFWKFWAKGEAPS